jgi:hypothetical protein
MHKRKEKLISEVRAYAVNDKILTRILLPVHAEQKLELEVKTIFLI